MKSKNIAAFICVLAALFVFSACNKENEKTGGTKAKEIGGDISAEYTREETSPKKYEPVEVEFEKILYSGYYSKNGLAPVRVDSGDEWGYGYIDREGNWIIKPEFHYAGQFNDGGLAIVEDRINGLIDDTGTLVTELQYDIIKLYDFGNSELARVGVRNWGSGEDSVMKYGYVDKTGAWIIEPQFNAAEDFASGMAWVGYDRADELDTLSNARYIKWGIIDETGKWILEPEFSYHGEPSNGLCAVRSDGKFGYIDADGNIVIEPQFDFAYDFDDNGTAVVKIDGRDGLIDKTGAWVIEPDYEVLWNFGGCGLAAARSDGKYGYINKKGAWVIEPQFDVAYAFNDNGLAVVSVRDGRKNGCIDTKGNWVIEPVYNNLFSFDENGLAVVETEDGKYGLIDEKGSYIAEPQYDLFRKFDSNGLAVVGKLISNNMKYGLLNRDGSLAAEMKFEYIRGFTDNGLSAAAAEDEMYGFIDRTGNWVIEPEFDWVSDFDDGLARVQVGYLPGDTKYGYIDETGAFAVEPEFYALDEFNKNGAALAGLDERYYSYIDKTGAWAAVPKDAAYKYDTDKKPSSESDYVRVRLHDVVRRADFNDAGIAWVGFDYEYKGDGIDYGGEMRYGMIDKTGTWVIKPGITHHGSFSSGLGVIFVHNGGCGYIDKNGNIIIDPKFGFSHDFDKNGLAVVSVYENEYGIIDKAGEWVIEPKYSYLWDFGNYGLAAAVLADECGPSYGFIDKTGAWVIAPEFDFLDVTGFKDNGLAVVYDSRRNNRYIDLNGNWATNENE